MRKSAENLRKREREKRKREKRERRGKEEEKIFVSITPS